MGFNWAFKGLIPTNFFNNKQKTKNNKHLSNTSQTPFKHLSNTFPASSRSAVCVDTWSTF
jgi:hypothetical protein